MLFISLDKKVCLSEPRLNSVSLVASAVVLENMQKIMHKCECNDYYVNRKSMKQLNNLNTWCKVHTGF